jgi:hypothetical protein
MPLSMIDHKDQKLTKSTGAFLFGEKPIEPDEFFKITSNVLQDYKEQNPSKQVSSQKR